MAAGRAGGAGELAGALGQQERQLARRAERVGDRVAVLDAVGGPGLPLTSATSTIPCGGRLESRSARSSRASASSGRA